MLVDPKSASMELLVALLVIEHIVASKFGSLSIMDPKLEVLEWLEYDDDDDGGGDENAIDS
jgi:hypothetical protein